MGVYVTQKNEIKEHLSSNLSRARELFKEHGNFLRIIISLHIGNESDADDFFQELFLFFILRPLPENISSIKGLLNKIVADRAKDFYRKKSGYKRRINRYAKLIENKDIDSYPEIMLIEKEETEKMFRLIRRNLPAKEAQAVTLKFKYGYNNKEISNKMEINSRSVSRYISVGLNKVKTLWA